MNFGHLRPGECRAPETEILPDGRKRLTRFFKVTHKSKIPADLDDPFGTVDAGTTPEAGWTGLRLTAKKVTDEVGPDSADTQPLLLLTYEQIHATDETAVGEAAITRLEDGRSAFVLEWLQFAKDLAGATNPATSRVVGSTITIGATPVFLLKEEAPDDGNLRRIRRTYVTAGTIATDLQTKQNGKLLIQTITSVMTVPATPGGYTLIGEPAQHPGGLPIYTYTYAKGDGEVSRETRYSQSDDNGTTGVTSITIRHLTASSVTVNPITPPGGMALILVDRTDQDGYRVWTATYSNGTGMVVDTLDYKNGGKLVVYRRVALGAAPTTPSASIGGTVTATGTSVRKDSGYDVYDYTWAEGEGEISREIRYSQSIDAGVNGATIVTIRHLSALSVSANPITTPASMVLFSEERSDQDGYRLWTASYGKGAGTVLESVEIKNGGELYVYRRVALGAAPSAPAASTGGTVTLVGTTVRQENGYTVYDYQWAEGNGEISRDIDYSQSVDQGAAGVTRTVIRHLTALSVTADPTSLGGSINIGATYVCQDGYKLWTSVYAKGTGTADSRDVGREDGSFVYYRTTLSATASTPSTPAGARLIDLDQSPQAGFFVNRAVFVKPPATNTFRRTGKFEVPGLAYFVGTDLILQPPTTRNLLFSIEVSYATAQDTTAPFTVNTWGGFTETYIPTASGQPINRQIGLNGYLCTGTTISGSGTYKGVAVDSYSAQRFASDPTSIPTGSTLLSVDNEPYLTALDGTIIYKITKVSATL